MGGIQDPLGDQCDRGHPIENVNDLFPAHLSRRYIVSREIVRLTSASTSTTTS